MQSLAAAALVPRGGAHAARITFGYAAITWGGNEPTNGVYDEWAFNAAGDDYDTADADKQIAIG